MTNEELIVLIKKNINVNDNLEQLYKQNKKFIYKTVKGYVTSINDIEDLMQIAFIGMVQAVEYFNQNRECKFFTVLTYFTKNNIRQYTEFPTRLMTLINKYKKYIDSYYKQHGHKPNETDILRTLNISKKQLYLIKNNLYGPLSLNQELKEDSEDSLINIICDDNAEVGQDNIEHDEIATTVNNAINKLSIDQQKVIIDKYYNNKSLYQIAQDNIIMFNIVKTLEFKAIDKLRKDNDIITLGKDYNRIRHITLSEFKRTGTSSVEWAILNLEKKKLI